MIFGFLCLTIIPWMFEIGLIWIHGDFVKDDIVKIRKDRAELLELQEREDKEIWQYGTEYTRPSDVTVYQDELDRKPTITVGQRQADLESDIEYEQSDLRKRIVYLGILAVCFALMCWGYSVMWSKITM